jgi:radical SAM superfamily enzyme YgiQ (UPF0313 family)
VSPVGLEYVGESLTEAGLPVEILDLSFAADWRESLSSALRHLDPLATAVTVRNTDDCCFASRRSFLPWIKDVVSEIKKLIKAPVILGGAGFSTMPEATLRATGADAGIRGDGEEAMVALARCLAKGENYTKVPNLIYQISGELVCNPTVNADSREYPLPRRRLFDSKRYEQLGGQVGIETKRGCNEKCIFCADPVAKGSQVRLRPPLNVVQELSDLLDQGINWFHLCDSEFNLPLSHAKEVCQAIIDDGLGDLINWYCYSSPVPFDRELANLMKRAGCAGVNFGADSICDEQLRRLGRRHTVNDIQKLAQILKEQDLNYIVDLLVGGPGETEETIRATIQQVRQLDLPLAGIAAGLRVYPDTPLSNAINNGTLRGKLFPGADCAADEPLFYLSPHLTVESLSLVNELIGDDPRFLFLASPNEEGSYNYADDDALAQLIEQGARGAYWDIIRRNRSS